MQSNKELFEQLEGFDPEVQKAIMAGLPCPDMTSLAKDIEAAAQAKQVSSEPVPMPKLNRKQRRAAAKKAIHKAKKDAKMPEPKTYYTCDPSKNIQCAKTSCHINGGPCKCTTNLKYAKQPVEKVQVIIPVSGEERRDLMKQCAKELKKQ